MSCITFIGNGGAIQFVNDSGQTICVCDDGAEGSDCPAMWTPVTIPGVFIPLLTEAGDEILTEDGQTISLDGFDLWTEDTVAPSLWTKVTPNPASWVSA